MIALVAQDASPPASSGHRDGSIALTVGLFFLLGLLALVILARAIAAIRAKRDRTIAKGAALDALAANAAIMRAEGETDEALRARVVDALSWRPRAPALTLAEGVKRAEAAPLPALEVEDAASRDRPRCAASRGDALRPLWATPCGVTSDPKATVSHILVYFSHTSTLLETLYHGGFGLLGGFGGL